MSWTTGNESGQVESSNTVAVIRQDLGGRPVTISATDDGPQITWGDDVLAAVDRGLVVVVINPAGRVIGRWHYQPDETPGAQVPPAAFVLRGEVPCETLRTTQRVDVSKVLAEGGWYATVEGPGTAEITVAGAALPAEWRHYMINGRGEAAIVAVKAQLILTAIPGTRSVFRLSLPMPRRPVTATLESSDHAVRVCQAPVPAWPATGALDIGPTRDEHFDPGWHLAEEAGTQQFRWSARSSSMRWRMDQPSDVRLWLRLRAAHANGAIIRASLNGVELTSCTLPAGAWTECRLDASASATRAGLNDLRLSSDTVAPDRPGDPRELAFVMQDGRVRIGK
jgi:hypothetical protein